MRFKSAKKSFDGSSDKPYKLSRTGVDLFIKCPRCFYLDKKFGIKQPGGAPFTLNSAVDALLKKEFDIHRAAGTPHPLMKAYKLDAVPFQHSDLDVWRQNFKGVQFLHQPTNLLLTGAVDDVWVTPKKELIVVEYKATSKNEEIELNDSEFHQGYRRQMEFYQWLLRQNGFKVSDTGYFVYCNGKRDREAFDGKLEFDVTLLPYTGNGDWIEPTLLEIKKCLMSDKLPQANETCEFCAYRQAAAQKE
jgi:hypothetical protein